MFSVEKTTPQHPDFIRLILALDEDIAIRDGDEKDFHAQYNKTDNIKHALLVFDNKKAVGCGALRHYDSSTIEIKRMYVSPESRGKGIATQILIALEDWARSLGYTRAILETGEKYQEAIALYTKNGYERIPNYGQYEQVLSSRCFSKELGDSGRQGRDDQ
jgi:putative acetyltransferase